MARNQTPLRITLASLFCSFAFCYIVFCFIVLNAGFVFLLSSVILYFLYSFILSYFALPSFPLVCFVLPRLALCCLTFSHLALPFLFCLVLLCFYLLPWLAISPHPRLYVMALRPIKIFISSLNFSISKLL